jgi:hypothetical protein
MNTPKQSILRDGEDARGADLWKVRFRTPGNKTWFVVKGTKPEVDEAAAILQAEGKEVVVSRL